MSGEIVAGDLVRRACQRHLDDLENGRERGLWFDAESAQLVIDFFPLLTHGKGVWAGQPFELEPWEKFVVGSIFGWKRADGSRRFRVAHVEVARKNGKALALDTPLPTPSGWTTMGEVREGDTVFDESGNPCRVTFATPIQHNRECYEVEFSDGCKIVADADHLWFTTQRVSGLPRTGLGAKSTWHERHVRTTKQIADTLVVKRAAANGLVEWNHRVPVARSIQTAQADLPVDPYVLGVWLGDGHSASARMTCSTDDVELLSHVLASGVSVIAGPKDSRSKAQTFLLGSGGRSQKARNSCLQSVLRRIGLLGNKHIPAVYLRASEPQRMALLQGLMDTDGYCSKAGQCEFTTTRKALADGFVELVRSLGLKAQVMIARATLNGVDVGPKWRIQFFAFNDRPVFRLARKAARQKERPEWDARSESRQIVSVKPVQSVSVRCIQVDSPSHLYLAGESMIPTHNTTLAAGIGLFLLVLDGEIGAEVYAVATKRDQAKLTHGPATRMVRSSPMLCEHVQKFRDNLSVEATDSKFEPLGADADTLDGLNISGAICDELHAWKVRDLWDVIETATGARRQPLILAITTAGTGRAGIWWERRDLAVKVLEGLVQDDALFAAIYTLDTDDDWTDERNWIKANPSLGVSLRVDEIREKIDEAKATPGKQNATKRLRLNIPTQQVELWLDLDKWDKCGGGLIGVQPGGEAWQSLADRQCFTGVDLSATTDMSALAHLFPPVETGEPLKVLMRFFLPDEDLRERCKRDRADYQLWADQKYLELIDGPVIEHAVIEQRIREDAKLFQIQKISFDMHMAASITTNLTADAFPVEGFGQGFISMASPVRELEKAIATTRFAHGGHPVLRFNAGCAACKQDPAGNRKPDKANSTGRIDGLYAILNALGKLIVAEPTASVYSTRGILVIGESEPAAASVAEPVVRDIWEGFDDDD